MTIALFPGQGVQAPGMARGLVEPASDVFDAASDVLGVDVVELCTHGRTDGADLGVTRWAQPAVLVCSVAAFRVAQGRESFVAAAGHSVGEYAALVAAEVLDVTDAVRLVAERADATDAAGRATPGGMAAVMRMGREALEGICRETGIVLAADNGPGQFVVSGPVEPLRRATEAIAAAGGVCRRLDVSAAFHSPVMASAADRLEAAVGGVRVSPPSIDLWSTTAAAPVRSPDEIRHLLVQQLTSPVRWRETVTAIAQRHRPIFCDLGPGRVVAGLTRRVVEGAEVRTFEDLVAAAGGTG